MKLSDRQSHCVSATSEFHTMPKLFLESPGESFGDRQIMELTVDLI